MLRQHARLHLFVRVVSPRRLVHERSLCAKPPGWFSFPTQSFNTQNSEGRDPTVAALLELLRKAEAKAEEERRKSEEERRKLEAKAEEERRKAEAKEKAYLELLQEKDNTIGTGQFIVERAFQRVAEQYRTLDYKGPPQVPSDITRAEFDFRDRGREVAELTKAFCEDFLGFYLKSSHKKDRVLIAITGGSGVGKTRLSITMLPLIREELIGNPQRYLDHLHMKLIGRTSSITAQEMYDALLADLSDPRKSHTLYFDVSNGDYIDNWNRPESMESAFLFSLVSKAYFPKAKVNQVKALLDDATFRRCATFPAVASALRQCYGLTEKERLTIVANIDEFQKKITDDDLKLLQTEPTKKDHILLRQIVQRVMSACMQLGNHNIHVIPVFSGTLSLAYIGIFPATDYTLRNLSIGPLSVEASQEIVRKALGRDDIPNSLVGAMGGVARGLEFLVKTIRSQPNKNTWNSREVFNATVNCIEEKYGINGSPLTPRGVRGLIRLCLSGKEVTKNDEIDGVPLGTLEKDGVLFMKPSTHRKGCFQVIVPLAFAAAFNGQLKLFDPNFVTYKPVVKSQDLEIFARNFEVFENNLLVDLGIQETTFGERFSGALMSDTLKQRPIVLRHMTAFTSVKERLPEAGTTMAVVERTSQPVDLQNEAVGVWIGRNCPTNDNIYTFPGQANGKTFICLDELKSTLVWQKATSAGVRPGDVRAEKKAAEQANKIFPSSSFEVFFHFVSNKRLATPVHELQQDILADDCTMITSKEQFPARFSPMFAPIALGDDDQD